MEKEISYTDLMEINLQHFAYKIPIYKIAKQMGLTQGFVGTAISTGMRDKKIWAAVKSIMDCMELAKGDKFETMRIFSNFK